jgi:hypothetical protein
MTGRRVMEIDHRKAGGHPSREPILVSGSDPDKGLFKITLKQLEIWRLVKQSSNVSFMSTSVPMQAARPPLPQDNH